MNQTRKDITMKRIIILIIALFLSLTASAQGFKLNAVSANLGKGSVSSGYDIVLKFKNEAGESFSVIGNHTRMYVAYDWPVGCLDLIASGGFNKNTPWIGPKLLVNAGGFLSTMHWLGISAGKPENPEFKARVMVGFNAVYLKVWNFRFSYSLLNWLDETPQHIPGLFYENKIGEGWEYSVGSEYNLREKEPLFQFGLKKVF